jgi:sugar transport system substrate-binding protein
VVDISGKEMGALALDLAIMAIDGGTSDKIVQAPIAIYATAEDGAGWLETHPDGLP